MENELYCGGYTPEAPEGRETDCKPQITIDKENIIVRFSYEETPECRQKIRDLNGVTQFQTCSCGNQNFELWGVDSTHSIITEGPDDGGVKGLKEEKNRSKGERHFRFTLPKPENFKPLDGSYKGDICLSGQEDDKVNIAIFDTGVDYRYFEGSTFLYNTAKFGKCPGYNGWNFIGNGSPDVFDRHGHGTFVTKIISDFLEEKGIGYRILPLKVLDDDGNGSLWGLLCALSYLEQIQRQGAQIHLANLSLGGTIATEFFNESDFLNEIIQKLDQDILFLTSAGNEGTNTDSGIHSHFPSSYIAENILAVGGYLKDKKGNIRVHDDSNYGLRSIDLAVPYEGYNLSETGLPSINNLKGTSYGTAYVTAMAANFLMNSGREVHSNPLEIKKMILDHADKSTNLRDNKISRNRAIVD